MATLNRVIAGRTIDEWRQDHKDKLIIDSRRYYQNNREQITQRLAEPYECECGSVCWKGQKSRHLKSKKHQDFINNQ